MTKEEFEKLKCHSVRESIEANLDRDPLEVALDGKILERSLVAGQVKYLRKARKKLPTFYEARCIIPGKAYEQCSSEVAAAANDLKGNSCLDLTCGLGVDSYYLSRNFDRVVSLEPDPVLAGIAAYNFGLLGADNITVVNTTAGEYLATLAEGCFDLVYADPDRRGEDAKKKVTLQDCSPDILGLMDRLREISDKVVVKLSPMFDVKEALRVFGEGTSVTVKSLNGECKEVVAEICSGEELNNSVRLTANLLGKEKYTFQMFPLDSGEDSRMIPANPSLNTGEPVWLIVPDVALVKIGCALRWFRGNGYYIETENSFAFSRTETSVVPGKVYRVRKILPFRPKELKKYFASNGLKKINILRKDFPLTVKQVKQQIRMEEGGTVFCAFTRLREELICILLDTP